jgi:Raf kinase inhibitor-like YbhB/YbcL family protein
MMHFELTSPAFGAGGAIPTRFTGEGDDVSPELRWSEPPLTTREFALICDDPDAPSAKPWVHWVIYKIGTEARRLAENVPKTVSPAGPSGVMQGVNSFDNIGYGGPMPPVGHGVHHYNFVLYSLDEELALKPGLRQADLLVAMTGHILAETRLTGTYERPRFAGKSVAGGAAAEGPESRV